MDDRTWRLAVGTLAAAFAGVSLDAILGKAFDIPAGFWGVLSGMLAFLGGYAAIKSRNGRKSD